MYSCVSNSNNEPLAIDRNCIVSFLCCLPQPSAIFDGTETTHRLICETIPNCSDFGNLAESS